MGYDLHITRKANWCDEAGPAIAEAEWRSLIESDPELSLDAESKCVTAEGEWVFAAWNGTAGVLGYHAGEITAKNSGKPLIAKMVRIAQMLNARVQGDDGEIYREDGASFQPDAPTPVSASPSLFSRVKAWFRHRRDAHELQQAAPSFRVGQRVRNFLGEEGIVLRVDPKANGGLGSVRIRMADGREQRLACVASGLEIVDEPR